MFTKQKRKANQITKQPTVDISRRPFFAVRFGKRVATTQDFTSPRGES